MTPAPRTDFNEKHPLKRYLGDSVYADFQNGSIVLTLENGILVTNEIILEPEVYEALVQYATYLRVRKVLS